jgi:hypothetical protein
MWRASYGVRKPFGLRRLRFCCDPGAVVGVAAEDSCGWRGWAGWRVGGLRWPPWPDLNGLADFSSSGWRGRYGPVNQVSRAMRGDGVAVGQQFTGVFEDHDAVAEQAPALFGVADEGPSRLVVRGTSARARG